MANMKHIAEKAGVSLGTVSNVLNGSAKVRNATRQRVLDAVAALRYQPSELARGLRRERTRIIGMIIPDVTNPFFPGVVRGAEDVAFANGHRLILCNTDNDHAKELIFLNELRTYRPAGLIVIPSNFSDLVEQAKSYRDAGTAIVCIDRTPQNWSGDTVTVDNANGTYRATRYLIELGHTKIAAVMGPLHLTNSRQRLLGFKRAMREAKIEIIPNFVQETTFDKQGGNVRGIALLRMNPRPTAILAGNDLIALGVLLALRQEGLNCPADVSLMGFDNLDVTELTYPSLSCVSQSGHQLGATAARILLERVSGGEGRARHIVLGTELKIRNSTAPPGDFVASNRMGARGRAASKRRSPRRR
jgi:LacI family transcriptional regulator